jgi:hypothetical protein
MANTRSKKQVQKAIKKMHPAYILIVVFALVIGIAGGYLAGHFMYGKDTLALVGEKETVVEAGTEVTYTDEGIKYVSKGKDLSDKYIITDTNMTAIEGKLVGTPTEDEELYIVYTVTEGRAKGQTLYRIFKVAGGEA